MKKLITIMAMTIALTLCGCKGQGEKIETTNNDYNVKLLFEVDGVKVYRFQDGLRSVYFTNANGKCSYSTSTKNSTTHIDTLCNAEE